MNPKTFIKILPKKWRGYFADIIGISRINHLEKRLFRLSQLFAVQQFPQLKAGTEIKSELNRYEASVFSQNGEDGVIMHIFSKIGVKNGCFVEFGSGDGYECNTANLAVNFDWQGLHMDGSKKNVLSAKKYFGFIEHCLGKRLKVVIAQEFITKENINSILKKHKVSGEIDLLSIDIDGNDYWVWEAIDCINPRVVVIEYNASFKSEKAVTVKYDPLFNRFLKHPSGMYHGASLAAMTKLAHSKGYVLIGCESNGINAFFVRKDVVRKKFKELPPNKAYFPHKFRTDKLSVDQQFDIAKNCGLVEV